MKKPEDKIVDVFLDLSVSELGGAGASMEDSVISVVLAEQLLLAATASSEALRIVKDKRSVNTTHLESAIRSALEEIWSVYTDVVDNLSAEAQMIAETGYFHDGDSGENYTYALGRREGYPVLRITQVEEGDG